MRIQHLKILPAILLAGGACLLAAAVSEAQEIRGYSQFLVSKDRGDNGDNRPSGNVKNPSNRPVFVLGISYWPDGTLNTTYGAGGCFGVVIPPHGFHRIPAGTENEICFEVPDDPAEALECKNVRRSTELIAVRSGNSDPLRGVFDDDHPEIGVVASYRKHNVAKAMRASDFHLPTGATKDQLLQCACSQLDANNLGNDLMEEVGIFCP